MDGLLLLDKDEGMTSQSCVSRVKRLFGAVKAGHTGTLDPMATGLLPILLGRATRAGEFLLCSDKHYRAVLRLGMTTDTEDITGKVLSACDTLPSPEEVEAVLARFRGELLQTPPMYSALKVGGRKLVDLAREGVELERTPRPITIHALSATPLSPSDYALDVCCSKGTYIRTLCADIGRALGVGGCMAALRRMEAAGFAVAQSHSLADLTGMSEEQRQECIIPIHALFVNRPEVVLPAFFAGLARCGCPVSLAKLRLSLPIGSQVRLTDEKGFFALGEVIPDNPQLPGDGSAIRPIRQFD